MGLEALKDKIGDFAKDIRLNLSSVLSEEGAPGLSLGQIQGVALACAYQTKNPEVIQDLEREFSGQLSPEEFTAAKAATAIMAMNNAYYRYGPLAEDQEFMKLPARLRMNVIAKPGISQLDFELYSLAVSALNSCHFCIKSHAKKIRSEGITTEGIHSTIRIASVIQAAAQAVEIGKYSEN